MAQWHKTTEIEELTGVPETTLRRFLKRFKAYIIHERRGRLRFIHDDSIETIKRIRSRREAGASYEEIEQELESTAVYTMERTAAQRGEGLPEVSNDKIMKLLDAFMNQQNEINELKKEVHELKDEMADKEEKAKEEKMQLYREINQLLIESQRDNK